MQDSYEISISDGTYVIALGLRGFLDDEAEPRNVEIEYWVYD
jgi:hypothetical protein